MREHGHRERRYHVGHGGRPLRVDRRQHVERARLHDRRRVTAAAVVGQRAVAVHWVRRQRRAIPKPQRRQRGKASSAKPSLHQRIPPDCLESALLSGEQRTRVLGSMPAAVFVALACEADLTLAAAGIGVSLRGRSRTVTVFATAAAALAVTIGVYLLWPL